MLERGQTKKKKGVKERRLMVIHRFCPGFKTDERRGAPLGGGGATRCAVEVNRLEKREKTGERAVSHEGGGGVCVCVLGSPPLLKLSRGCKVMHEFGAGNGQKCVCVRVRENALCLMLLGVENAAKLRRKREGLDDGHEKLENKVCRGRARQTKAHMAPL